ncbi:MAG: hypothetical protein A2Z03_10400 [Chloroflexi bacterium RBG_16_56_8]|nr:MAG: hypothetical protein A2Z03_10400 [Chloroflexi bacterium RBG_16_56_8]
MEKRHRLVLYGRSLFLAGIAASFKEHPDLDVLLLDSNLPDAPQRANAMCPHTVIFELQTIDPSFALSFLQEHPGVILLGLDLASDKLVTLSSQQSTLYTMDDLMHVIEKRARLN